MRPRSTGWEEHKLATTLGFIGLGVMGEPMCRNLARKSGAAVVAFDRGAEPPAALARDSVGAAGSAGEVLARADPIFMCLPGEPQVRAVALGPDGLAAHVRAGQTVVDMSTAPVALARALGHAFAARGVDFADAPVARTAQAAKDGTLSIMVGGDPAVFERLRPYLACMGTEITHCGPVGAGQAVKLMNNIVVAQTVVALAEALAVARASGAVDPKDPVRDADQGLGGQLRAAQSRDEVPAARHASHPRRVPDELHRQGPLVCARAGRVRGGDAGAGDDDEAPHGAHD